MLSFVRLQVKLIYFDCMSKSYFSFLNFAR